MLLVHVVNSQTLLIWAEARYMQQETAVIDESFDDVSLFC